MQHAPLAQLPEQRHPRDWGVIIATVVVISIAILTLVVLIEPDVIFAPATTNVATNPELGAFVRYQVAQSAAPGIAGPDNPELAAFSRYVELHPGDQMLRENPEVRQFQQWLEGQ